MGIQDLFTTTQRGLPDISNLPPSTTMARYHYSCSLGLQCILLLVFLSYFIMAIYRVLKKIKNNRFKELPEDFRRDEAEAEKTEVQNDNDHELEKREDIEQQGNLIYRFDEDDEQGEEKKDEQKADEAKSEEDKRNGVKSEKEDEQKKSVESNYNDYHDENEQKFISIDDKLIFLQPFVIGFIVSNNFFAADVITIIAIILMLLSYLVFNLKGYWGHIRITPLLFMVFGLFGFLSFFINDHDVTT